MSKKMRIIGASAGFAILIIAAGVFLALRGEPAPTVNQPVPTVSQSQTSIPQGGKTYKEFVNSGRSEVCTFVTNIDDVVTTGTVYAAYGKIRTDFVLTYPTGTAHQHLVVDSLMAYMWSNASNVGLKFAVEESNEDSKLNNIFGEKGYQCVERPVDIKLFELPADVAFTDLTGI